MDAKKKMHLVHRDDGKKREINRATKKGWGPMVWIIGRKGNGDNKVRIKKKDF